MTNYRKIESGEIWDAYFEACENDAVYTTAIEMKIDFGRRAIMKEYKAFIFRGREIIVRGFDHFNGHFSDFTDWTAIYAIYIAHS